MTVRVHQLDCGTMCPIAGRLTGVERLVCRVLAIETPADGVILVDTGFGERDCAEPRRVPATFRALVRPRLDRAQTAVARLAALGLSPRDVRHVLVTHLDLDHAGGLPDFPWAKVHLHVAEHDGAMRRRTLAERSRYLTRQWAHAPAWVTYAPTDGDRWLGLPAVRQLAGVTADVALVPLVGHTRGHSGVAVRDGDRWLLHAGDAVFHRRELAPAGRAPLVLSAFAWLDEHDPRARRASVAALRDLARRPDVTVVCSHDPAGLPA